MKPYSTDMRERIVRFVTDGGTKAEASRKFNVCYKTVQRYVSKTEHGESLTPRPQGGSKKRFSDDRLQQEVKETPSATLKKHAQTLGVSPVAVWKRLRQLKITLKKNS